MNADPLFLFLPMELLVDLAEAFVGDVGVDLRGRDGRVAEHGLHRADVRAVVEEVRREAVSESVRVDVFDDASFDGAALHQPLHAPISESQAPVSPFLAEALLRKGDEQSRIHIGPLVDVSLECGARGIGEEDDPELGTLATDAEFALVEIDLGAVEPRQLRDPEAGREEEFEDGTVPTLAETRSVSRLDEAHHLVELEEVHLPVRDLADLDLFRGHGLDILLGEEFEERAKDDDMVDLGRLAEGLAAAVFGAVEEDPELADPVEGDVFGTLRPAPGEKLLEGALVVRDRPRGAAEFDLEVAREPFHEGLEGGCGGHGGIIPGKLAFPSPGSFPAQNHLLAASMILLL